MSSCRAIQLIGEAAKRIKGEYSTVLTAAYEPEETKDVKAAIGSARAKNGRQDMIND